MRRIAGVIVSALLAAGCGGDDPSSAPETSTTTTTTAQRYVEAVTDEIVETLDVEYGTAPDSTGAPQSLHLDLFEPVIDDDTTRRPVAVFVHGGGFFNGDKGVGPSPELARHFAELGYVTASINYRLLAPPGCGGGVTNPCVDAAIAGIHDAKAAVRWLRANADDLRIDPTRIAIGGESAGGITAAGVGAAADSEGESGNPGQPSTVSAWMSLSGGLPGGIFVDDTDAPGILFSGTDDPIVPHSWSVETRDAMQRAGVEVELVEYDGLQHVPWGERRDDIIERTAAFFYEHLRLADR